MAMCFTRNFQYLLGVIMGKTHGMSKGTRVYRKWAGMKTRCYNQNEPTWKYYGGRGITVCDRWKDSFENFYADMGDPAEDMTLDRIDNNKGYSSENCRWATMKQQAVNRSNNHWIEYDGERKTLYNWAKDLGIDHTLLIYRIKAGWSVGETLGFIERKVARKPYKNARYLTYNGETKDAREWAKERNIKRTTLLMRLDNYEWPLSKALGYKT